MEDEVDRFRDSHEEALDLGVSYGYRSSPLDLVKEFGNHAAVATEHVTEPDHGETRGAAQSHQTHHEFSRTLARSHYAGRPHRLIRRNQNEALGPVTAGGFCDDARATHVVLDCLTGILLDQGNVFVGGGMNHNF